MVPYVLRCTVRSTLDAPVLYCTVLALPVRYTVSTPVDHYFHSCPSDAKTTRTSFWRPGGSCFVMFHERINPWRHPFIGLMMIRLAIVCVCHPLPPPRASKIAMSGVGLGISISRAPPCRTNPERRQDQTQEYIGLL